MRRGHLHHTTYGHNCQARAKVHSGQHHCLSDLRVQPEHVLIGTDISDFCPVSPKICQLLAEGGSLRKFNLKCRVINLTIASVNDRLCCGTLILCLIVYILVNDHHDVVHTSSRNIPPVMNVGKIVIASPHHLAVPLRLQDNDSANTACCNVSS